MMVASPTTRKARGCEYLGLQRSEDHSHRMEIFLAWPLPRVTLALFQPLTKLSGTTRLRLRWKCTSVWVSSSGTRSLNSSKPSLAYSSSIASRFSCPHLKNARRHLSYMPFSSLVSRLLHYRTLQSTQHFSSDLRR